MSVFGKTKYQISRISKFGLMSEYMRSFGAEKIWENPPLEVGKHEDVSLHSVGGREHLTMFAIMLTSWLTHSNLPCAVFFHDDGTLNADDTDRLHIKFPGIQVISKSESDQHITPKLDKLDSLSQYRKNMPHALKCIDTFFYATGSHFLLIDPDVVFFQNPGFILEWAHKTDNTDIWFNRDPQEPSPYTEATSYETYGFSIWPRVNSGLCLMQKSVLDLNFYESVFNEATFTKSIDWRKEQTALALLASRHNQGGLLPEEYDVTIEPNKQDHAVCRHYVGAVRHHFWREGAPQVLKDIRYG